MQRVNQLFVPIKRHTYTKISQTNTNSFHSLELFETLSACEEYHRPDEESYVDEDGKSYNCPTHMLPGMQLISDVKKTRDGERKIMESKHGECEYNPGIQDESLSIAIDIGNDERPRVVNERPRRQGKCDTNGVEPKPRTFENSNDMLSCHGQEMAEGHDADHKAEKEIHCHHDLNALFDIRISVTIEKRQRHHERRDHGEKQPFSFIDNNCDELINHSIPITLMILLFCQILRISETKSFVILNDM